MKSKIAVIIPYFGTLPNYFQTFLFSCKYVKMMDFLIFTDDDSINGMYMPETVSVSILSWSCMTQMISDRYLGQPIYAYKLCDYKPCYGVIFEEYIKDYDYWGYCDIDMLMGGVDSFLLSINYEKYDRIGRYGHFTLYKNSPSINNIFRINLNINDFPSFTNIIKTSFPCNNDEVWTNLICQSIGLAFLEDVPCANIDFTRNLHFHTYNRSHLPELFVWDCGRMYVYYKEGDIVHKEEKVYFHYMMRKDMPVHGELGEKILATNEGFYPFDETKINTYFQIYGRPDTLEESVSFQKNFKKKLWKNKKQMFVRELKSYGLIIFKNLWVRYRMTKLLKKIQFK